MFTLVTGVRPIKVRFLNRFLRLSDKGFSRFSSKKIWKKINFRVLFLPLKIAFFGGFENDNILSSKSYNVTKMKYLHNKSSDLYEIWNLSI